MADRRYTPSVAPDQPYGDAQMLQAAVKAAPIRPPATRTPPPAPAAGNRRGGGGNLDLILGRPSDRPGEPGSAGAPFGPGPGPMSEPDDRDQLIQYLEHLAFTYDSAVAQEHLNEIFTAAPEPIAAPPSVTAPPATFSESDMDFSAPEADLSESPAPEPSSEPLPPTEGGMDAAVEPGTEPGAEPA